ncbi:hypothetical protein P0Y35_13950 [Kiritimatiellaeota bacterium B1221]|nr:hypothetical protein [Kiritimatiellaeota bacterium B1221]
MKAIQITVVAIVISLFVTSCSEQTHKFGGVVGVSVSDEGDLAPLIGKAEKVSNEMEKFGFTLTSFTDSDSERVSTYSGSYKSFSGVQVKISCLKILNTKRSELRIEISGGESRNPQALEASSELQTLIKSWTQNASQPHTAPNPSGPVR